MNNKKLVLAFIAILLFSNIIFCQEFLQTKAGKITFSKVTSLKEDQFLKQQSPLDGKRFAVIQLSMPLTTEYRQLLLLNGIELYDYVASNSYNASFKEFNANNFSKLGIKNISYISPQIKVSPLLKNIEKYSWINADNGNINILIKLSPGITILTAKKELQLIGLHLITSQLETYYILEGKASVLKLNDIAGLSFVEWIEPAQPSPQTLNSKSENMSAANIARAAIPDGGYGLTGKGVVVGVGDNADPTNHIDLVDRVKNRSAYLFENHGTHVTGTVGGAGIFRYDSRGFAPACKIISQFFEGIYLNAANYVAEDSMMVTNNSYGNIVRDSLYEGVYDLYSRVIDQQAFQFPTLLHVFAAGNDGDVIVPPFPPGYANILSGLQSAKNTINVGRLDFSMLPSIYSSGGPTRDGRLKPEIIALGEGIVSCKADGNYYTDWGTSMAAPAVTGGVALMIEQYKKQFGANPKGGLMKAIVMNGTNDIGTPGPDFKNGYGLLDLERNLNIIKNNQFYSNSIANGNIQNKTIIVPPNTAQLKVMLYWHDPPAAAYATKTLVNDLDLEVIDPAGNVTLPQKLDTLPTNVANSATTGIDHINNSELVLINNPLPGNYTIRVKGTAININSQQEYFVVYDFLRQGLQLTVPFKNDTYFPGDLLMIQWRDNGTPSNQRTIEFFNGSKWDTIARNISDAVKYYRWTVPNVAITNARIRVTENGTSFSDTSGNFVILGSATPFFESAAFQCEGYCKVLWHPVNGATNYAVLMKQGPDMVIVGTTTDTTFIANGLSKDSLYWFSIQPISNGIAGKRSNGRPYQPNVGNCGAGISAGDLKVDAILNPSSGRKYASSELSNQTNLVTRIKNLDSSPVTGFTIKYSINGAPFISHFINASIIGSGTYLDTIKGLDFSNTGTYNIKVVVKNNVFDPVSKNDTLIKIVKHLANNAISLNTIFVENFDNALAFESKGNVIGIDSLDRWDFTSGTTAGRVRTFVNNGIARSGNRALTVDVNRFINSGSNNYIYGTFNLSNYNAAIDNIRMDVFFKQHGSFQTDNPANFIWARGSENDSWISIYDLNANQPAEPGEWKQTTSLDLSKALNENAQNFSTTTQIRIGQNSILGMGDDTHFGGYTFDDVRLYKVSNDVEVVRLLNPASSSCALTNSTPITVLLNNRERSALNNVLVTLQVDNKIVVTDTIKNFSSRNLNYTFSKTPDLSTSGLHTFKIWTSFVLDNFKENDTILTSINNLPVFSSFPYLQDFEENNGYFYTAGVNSSWEYGTPDYYKFNKAASGIKAWKTSLHGLYNDNELSYLYSPCFDVTTLDNPTLSFGISYDIEYCRPDPCDLAWVEYSSDGVNWIKLQDNNGINWYNNVTSKAWDSTKAYWHVATTALPNGIRNLRLRFVFNSDIGTTRQGIAIDDIHIYDKQFEIYDNAANSNIVSNDVKGISPVHFVDGGKLIATIYPNNNNLGSTKVKSYINTGSVRNDAYQYYADRNIIVQPTNKPLSPVTVRFYFLDKEVDTLRNAKNCNACSNPEDYGVLGVLKYSDKDTLKENDIFIDDTSGAFSFFNSGLVKKVPYGKGYYAEYNVNDFSEFWITNGNAGNIPTAEQWNNFTAEKLNNNDVLLKWSVSNDNYALKYDVELAQGANSNKFEKIGSMPAKNQNGIVNYSFTDQTSEKKGIHYYRIKRINKNNYISYSDTRTILFGNNGSNIVVYPNPVRDVLNIMLKAEANMLLYLSLYDAAGRLVLEKSVTASGSLQEIKLNTIHIAKGVYQLKIMIDSKSEIIKVVKD